MPLEINELVIRVTVNEDKLQAQSASTGATSKIDTALKEITDQVLKIIENKNER